MNLWQNHLLTTLYLAFSTIAKVILNNVSYALQLKKHNSTSRLPI